MKTLDLLCQTLNKTPLTKSEIFHFLTHIDDSIDDEEQAYEYLLAQGLPLRLVDGNVTLATKETLIDEQLFCFVDIETNGSKPSISQIIEIAAIKMVGSSVVGSFEELVYCDAIPQSIQEITQIKPSDLVNARLERDVLRDFKEFLGDAVFVAHNVNFDFQFLSTSCNRHYLGRLANRRLCTIELAKRTLESERYGLRYLTQKLGFPDIGHHRAYSDAYNSLKIFQICLQNLPDSVTTTEELIEFSRMPIVQPNTQENQQGSEDV